MSFAVGVRAFTDGARLCRDRQLLGYIWIPTLISFAIISFGLWVGYGYLVELGDKLANWLPGWLSFLDTVLVPLLGLIGLFVGAWFVAFLAVLIASPFFGALSQAVERKVWGSAESEGAGILLSIAEGFSREARKLMYHVPRLIGIFILTLVPVVNLAAPFLWLAFGAWMMAVQFCDYPGENRGQPFTRTLDKLRDNRSAALGFGVCTTAVLAIPLLNFLFVPVAVVGGTLLWRYVDGDPPAAQP